MPLGIQEKVPNRLREGFVFFRVSNGDSEKRIDAGGRKPADQNPSFAERLVPPACGSSSRRGLDQEEVRCAWKYLESHFLQAPAQRLPCLDDSSEIGSIVGEVIQRCARRDLGEAIDVIGVANLVECFDQGGRTNEVTDSLKAE